MKWKQRRISNRKQNDSKKQLKQKEMKQKKDNIVEGIDLDRFFELATSNKKYVNSVNLHEIKTQILEDYTGDSELTRLLIIGPVEHKANIRFKNMDDFESYKNAKDFDYDSEDVTFTGYVYQLKTPQFNGFKRSAYAKCTIYMQEIVEYHGQVCYIPTSGNFFILCINCFTNKDYTKEILIFIRTEQRRSNVMTATTIQPSCTKWNTNIGWFDGTRINPRNLTQKNLLLFKYNNLFCLIWKSQNISFNQVIENELKPILYLLIRWYLINMLKV